MQIKNTHTRLRLYLFEKAKGCDRENLRFVQQKARTHARTHTLTHTHTHTQGIQLSRDKWTCTCAVSPLDCRSVSVSGHFPGHCFFRLLAPMKRCSAGLTLGRHQTLAITVGPRTLPELGHLWPRGWPQPDAGPTLHRIKNHGGTEVVGEVYLDGLRFCEWMNE